MKYMGSKRLMLENGLGKLILKQLDFSNRFVDLFTGAANVASFVAERRNKPVLAIDLQLYSVILARAILNRDTPSNPDYLAEKWLLRAESARNNSKIWKKANETENRYKEIKQYVQNSRRLCEENSVIGPIWNAYGGHYFSPKQAITLDYLLKYLPENNIDRSVCLAALIMATSKCAAAPGHTAQPFQPTDTAAQYIEIAWALDPISVSKKELESLCSRHAKCLGKAKVGNAISVAASLKSTDLVFVDPPYSDVQYSRFYHVLETVAVGKKVKVFGVGRYPDLDIRPQSNFSRKGQSERVLGLLLATLAKSKTRVIFTFPKGKSSNGLSGDIIINCAKNWFHVNSEVVNGTLSTLGGNNNNRDARKESNELILLMEPK